MSILECTCALWSRIFADAHAANPPRPVVQDRETVLLDRLHAIRVEASALVRCATAAGMGSAIVPAAQLVRLEEAIEEFDRADARTNGRGA